MVFPPKYLIQEPVQITYWAIFIVIGVILGTILFFKEGKKQGIKEEDLYLFIIILLNMAF